jgi:hypothetical protein
LLFFISDSQGSTDASSGCSSPRTLMRRKSPNSLYLHHPFSTSGHTSPVDYYPQVRNKSTSEFFLIRK